MMVYDHVMEQYTHDRLISHEMHHHVIVPNDFATAMPLCCLVCSSMMRSREDELAWHDLECCDACSRAFAASRRIEWKSGWRPTTDEVLHDVSCRPPIVVRIAVD